LRDESNRSNTTTSSTKVGYREWYKSQGHRQKHQLQLYEKITTKATIAGVVREEVAGIPTTEGRDIEPRSTPTESRLYEMVLQSCTDQRTELLLTQERVKPKSDQLSHHQEQVEEFNE
jgi:hypothetical protein